MGFQLPSIRPKKLIKALQGAHFYISRITGSHYIMYRDQDNKVTSVPYHSKDIPKGTLHGILKDAGISPEDLIKLL